MSHVWRLKTWKKHININNSNYKSGLRMYFEQGIEPEVHAFLLHFAKWLRKEYDFPLRVNVYGIAQGTVLCVDIELSFCYNEWDNETF